MGGIIGFTKEQFEALDDLLSSIIARVGALEELITGSAMAEYVAAWLDDHPEATTTVEDDSITPAKLNESVALTSDELDAILV